MKEMLKILLNNPVMANLIMLMIVFSGFVASRVMVRETIPNFSLDMVMVTVAYPGADPEEVEEGICIKIEESLAGLQGVKKVITTANEGVGSAIVEVNDGEDLYQVMNDIKNRIDAITTFPVNAEKPSVSELKFRGDVMSVVIWGDLPEAQLKDLARRMEQEILRLPGVTQTNLSGIRNYEITIELSESKLRKYGLNFEQVRQCISRNGMNIPAGQIQTPMEDFRIRALGRKYSSKEYRDIPIVTRSDGTTITLGQVADIRDAFDEDVKKYSLFNGKPAVTVNVFKTEEEDTIRISEAVREYLDRKRHELPENIRINVFMDQARMVRDRLDLLYRNGITGLLLVFFALWLFLDLRLSFWVTMGIPISLAGGLALISLLGCSINMLSLFGLIMVLGMIVDDAIVVGESIYSRRQLGASMRDASIEGTEAVFYPVLAAVLTTIVAFVPLFFVSGVMGKFVRQIPIPVVAALAVSVFEALLILPVHLRHLPASTEYTGTGWRRIPCRIRAVVGGWMDYILNHIYSRLIVKVLAWRYISFSLAVFIFLLVAGLISGGIVKFVFFPKSDSDMIEAQIEMLPGTPAEETRKVAADVQEAWQRVSDRYRAETGIDLTKGSYSLVGDVIEFKPNSDSNICNVMVELLPSENRDVDSNTLVAMWQKEAGALENVYSTRFSNVEGGPGGNPIEIELRGENIDQLLECAQLLLNKLRSIDGLYDSRIDWRPGKREFVINVKPEAYAYGLSLNDIAEYVQGGFYGAEALRIQRGRDDIKVRVKFPEKNGRDSIAYFNQLRIKTPSGARVPFNTVAEIKLQSGQSYISRKDRSRVITIISDIDNNRANAREVYASLERDFLPGLLRQYNGEIAYTKGGEAEESQESFGSLLIWFPLSLFGIYFIIASIFKSYLQPMIIMTTIPFGMIGGTLGHMLFGLPLTILSMFGFVALAGIVVNDAIVMIDFVNTRLEKGLPLFSALADAGRHRFRAIFLTSLTTFAGLLPIVMERSFQAQFLKPMAVSIAFGVAFGTVLTLLLIPCVFAIMNDLRRLFFAMVHLRWPEREEVEPRSMTYHMKNKLNITMEKDK